jgi:hypothetical protein
MPNVSSTFPSFFFAGRVRPCFLLTQMVKLQYVLPITFAGRARSRFAERSARVFRCSDVEAGLAPSSASLAWLGQPPSQALKNATSSAFFTHAISAPLAPTIRARGTLALPRVRGASRKNPTADAEKHRQPRPVSVREPIQERVRLTDASPRSRRVFLAEGPAARISVRGVRRRPGNGRYLKVA